MVASWATLATCARRPLDDETGQTGAGGGTAGTGGTLGGGSGGSGGQTAGSSGTICGTFEQRSVRLPADILILLDASGSMDLDIDDMTCEGGCGARSKWARASAAINSLVTQTETTVNWGLKWFPDGSLCNLSAGPTVPVGPRNASAIATALAGRTSASGGLLNGGNTPTRAAEDHAARYLTDLTDGSPKFILLVTDGGSNCMPGNSSTQADDSEGSVQMVAFTKQSGIPTFVVGVTMAGSEAEAALNAMAVAGGYARVNSSPAFYPVATAAAELTSTYDSLVRVNPDCVFSIPTPPAGGTYPPIGVKLDGVDVPRDTSHTSGWDFTDDTFKAVRIYGTACTDVIAGNVETVSIVFYCRPGD